MDFIWYDIILFVVFCILTIIFLKKNKKKVKREGIIYLYKSRFGIKIMDNIVKKYKKFLKFISPAIIFIGFVGMIIIIALLVFSCYRMATSPEVIKTPPIVPLLPWVPFPGLPTLYFTYWIIAIFVLAVVHEGCHGIFARLSKIKIKSTGFGFLGPLPLAFVEPEEKELVKKSTKEQLSIFAAGPVSNLVLAALILACLSFVVNPLFANIENSPMSVVQVNESGPAYSAGIREGDIIKIENATTLKEYVEIALTIKPNQTIIVERNGETIQVETIPHPLNESIGSIQVVITPNLTGISKVIPYIPTKLIFWILITNIFVGLFNLLPLPIVDGGRMTYISLLALTKSKKKAEKISKKMYLFSLSLFLLLFLIWIVRMI